VKAAVAKALRGSSEAVEGDGADNAYYGEPRHFITLHHITSRYIEIQDLILSTKQVERRTKPAWGTQYAVNHAITLHQTR
jgi:hypothetical protein